MNLLKSGVLASLFLLVNLIAVPALAAGDHPLTLADIFKNKTYQPRAFGPVRWMKEGNSYSTLESNPEVGGKDIVSYDAGTGARSVLVSARQLIPDGPNKPLTVDDYQWSTDGARLLIFTNTRKVWGYKTRGDYWVLDLGIKGTWLIKFRSSRWPAQFIMCAACGGVL